MMDSMDLVTLVLRWIHILSAIVAVGGLLFARFAVLPTVDEFGKETADKIHAGIRRRWMAWVHGSITLLLASGLTNYILLMKRVKASPDLWGSDWMKETSYHTLFGVKFLLAMIIFYFASGLVGRGAGTQWIRDNRKRWLSVTVFLAVCAVLLSGWMRQLHTGPNTVPAGREAASKTYLEDLHDFNAPDAGEEEKPHGQETKEADGSAPSEDREAPAASGGSKEAA